MFKPLTLALCLAGSGLSAQGFDLHEVLNLPRATSLQFDRDVRINSDMRMTAKQVLNDAGYFGAFAVHPTGAYGFASEGNSIAAAEASALRFCGDVSGRDGRCEIAARLVPKGLTPDAYPPIGVNVSDGIIEVDGLNVLGYAAIAASGDGAWGSALNGRDPEEAIEIALKSCEEWRLSGGETPLSGFPCEVIVVMHSDVVLPLE